MTIKVVQDSIIFIAGLTMEELNKAMKFAPESTMLYAKDENGKKEPVCGIAYADEGSVSERGVVFDSTTDDGKLCTTIVYNEGNTPHCKTEAKKACITEKFSALILNMNKLEEQIKAALDVKKEEIEKASTSVEVISL